MFERDEFLTRLKQNWADSIRWKGLKRPYTAEDVYRLKGTIHREYSIAKATAKRLWDLFHQENYVNVLSAVTGNQAIQQVKAGLKAIYVSGWQVAADMNNSLRMYPDQSLYPSDSVPYLIRRINNSLLRADQIHHMKDDHSIHWLAPIVADAEAGFGGSLHAFEIMKMMIEDGAAGVHFEDQLASVKKCGHLGGKVLVPTQEFVTKLIAARLAADVSGVDTILVARTDAYSASLLTNDIDPYDRPFIHGDRTSEGFWRVKAGMDQAISRGLAYAPYADLLWFETSKPDLAEAKQFSEAIHKQFPGKFLAYNCSPSFNWKANLDEATIAKFQNELGQMGYKFQFVTLSGFHALNHSMFNLAQAYKDKGMAAYSKLQEAEFEAEKAGYEAIKHQDFVGTGYFDLVTEIATGGNSSTLSMKGSTEEEQFKK
ncbi:MAG: isocitrate lyase [Candidatus Omnitrophica bacterium]|nr:isocitrate lyase [Candidatus Omnitrophota bacterium]